MVNVQVKNVPEETHAVLKRRAAAAHQSLQEYLLQYLIAEATSPTDRELLEKIECGEGGRTGASMTFAQAVEAIEEGRAGR